MADLVGIVKATGDLRPIYWLAESFMGDPASRRDAAVQQMAMLAPIFVTLAEQAGIQLQRKR